MINKIITITCLFLLHGYLHSMNNPNLDHDSNKYLELPPRRTARQKSVELLRPFTQGMETQSCNDLISFFERRFTADDNANKNQLEIEISQTNDETFAEHEQQANQDNNLKNQAGLANFIIRELFKQVKQQKEHSKRLSEQLELQQQNSNDILQQIQNSQKLEKKLACLRWVTALGGAGLTLAGTLVGKYLLSANC